MGSLTKVTIVVGCSSCASNIYSVMRLTCVPVRTKDELLIWKVVVLAVVTVMVLYEVRRDTLAV